MNQEEFTFEMDKLGSRNLELRLELEQVKELATMMAKALRKFPHSWPLDEANKEADRVLELYDRRFKGG